MWNVKEQTKHAVETIKRHAEYEPNAAERGCEKYITFTSLEPEMKILVFNVQEQGEYNG